MQNKYIHIYFCEWSFIVFLKGTWRDVSFIYCYNFRVNMVKAPNLEMNVCKKFYSKSEFKASTLCSFIM